MARYVVQVDSLATLAANATTLATEQNGFLQALTPLARAGATVLGAQVTQRTEWATQAQADNHYNDQVAKQTTGLNRLLYLAGSRVTKHVCRHDEGVSFCVIQTQAVK